MLINSVPACLQNCVAIAQTVPEEKVHTYNIYYCQQTQCTFYYVANHHNVIAGHPMTAAILRNMIKGHPLEGKTSH